MGYSAMLPWKYGEGKQTCLVLNAKMALFLVDFMGLLTKLWDVVAEIEEVRKNKNWLCPHCVVFVLWVVHRFIKWFLPRFLYKFSVQWYDQSLGQNFRPRIFPWIFYTLYKKASVYNGSPLNTILITKFTCYKSGFSSGNIGMLAMDGQHHRFIILYF